MHLGVAGPTKDRGAINWNGEMYRVMGTSLVKILADGTLLNLGAIAGQEQVSLDYSFDNLIIAGGGNLYYFNGVLKQATDVDFKTVLDAIWVDGYTMTTDGTDLIVTELGDPYSVNPLKYGSAEEDPDPGVPGDRALDHDGRGVGRGPREPEGVLGVEGEAQAPWRRVRMASVAVQPNLSQVEHAARLEVDM